MPRVSIGAARTALGVGVVDAAARVGDLASSTVKDVTKTKWTEDPNDPGRYVLGPHHEQVVKQGMGLMNAIAQAAPQAARDAA